MCIVRFSIYLYVFSINKTKNIMEREIETDIPSLFLWLHFKTAEKCTFFSLLSDI